MTHKTFFFFFFIYRCNNLHTFRDSVSPVCWIFLLSYCQQTNYLIVNNIPFFIKVKTPIYIFISEQDFWSYFCLASYICLIYLPASGEFISLYEHFPSPITGNRWTLHKIPTIQNIVCTKTQLTLLQYMCGIFFVHFSGQKLLFINTKMFVRDPASG